MSTHSQADASRARLYLLAAVLFVSYLCVAIPLPVIPVFVTHQLGLDNVWAGLGVGVAFFTTIFTRGYAGKLADRHGAKTAVARGMLLYAAGAAVSLLAGLSSAAPAALATLIAGRLLLGVGESLVGVGIITWGVGLMGPARSGQVLAVVGAAFYGAFVVGGPLGLLLFDRVGFAGTMAISAVLPLLGLAAIAGMAGVAPHPHAERPSFLSVVGQVWLHGLVVCLQGIGFAAIGAGFVLVRMSFGHLPDRIGGLPVAIGSLAVETVGQFLIWGAHDPALALAGAFLTGLGCSMVFPAMGREVVHLVAPHLRGTAMGAFAAFQDLAYGLTGPVAGLLADRAGYGHVFLTGGLAALAGLLIALYLRRARVAVAQ
ncbi:MFS transporter [Burkholderia gladioli]|uniref:MFS transporter n=1 Tax=Burkholderia gladioli TaxID=28095 RepID=UPI0016403004|nr:MFS transporter [Burkholderia gladioli]